MRTQIFFISLLVCIVSLSCLNNASSSPPKTYIKNFHLSKNITYPTDLRTIIRYSSWERQVLNYSEYIITNINLRIPSYLSNGQHVLAEKMINNKKLFIFHAKGFLSYIFHGTDLIENYKQAVLYPDTINCYPLFFDFDGDAIQEIIVPYFFENSMSFCIYKLIDNDFKLIYSPTFRLKNIDPVLETNVNQNIFVEFKHINSDKYYDFILYGTTLFNKTNNSFVYESIQNGKQIFLSQDSYNFIKQK